MSDYTATPSQTLGPFYAYGLLRDGDADLAGPNAGGERIELAGRLTDGVGAPVRDALIELWQADAEGRYAGRDDGADPDFKGFGRTLTRPDGTFSFQTVLPGPSAGTGNSLQAPHFAIGVFSAGLMRRVVTRIYAPDTELLESDALLSGLPDSVRPALIAEQSRTDAGGPRLSFEVRLAGEGATPVFQD